MGAAALPPLVDVDDFALWPGVTVIEATRPSAEALLRRASALVRAYTRRAWVAADGVTLVDVPDDVAGVVIQAAARVWANPTGAVKRTTGPFGVEYTDDRAEGLFLTATERQTLAQYRTAAAANGLQVLSTTRGDMAGGDLWVGSLPAPGGIVPFLAAEDLQ